MYAILAQFAEIVTRELERDKVGLSSRWLEGVAAAVT